MTDIELNRAIAKSQKALRAANSGGWTREELQACLAEMLVERAERGEIRNASVDEDSREYPSCPAYADMWNDLADDVWT
jgi:hypothetical protein